MRSSLKTENEVSMCKLEGGTPRRTEGLRRSWEAVPLSEQEARAGTLAAVDQSRPPNFDSRADLIHDLAGLHVFEKSALPSNFGERDWLIAVSACARAPCLDGGTASADLLSSSLIPVFFSWPTIIQLPPYIHILRLQGEIRTGSGTVIIRLVSQDFYHLELSRNGCRSQESPR